MADDSNSIAASNKSWVKFEEEGPPPESKEYSGAVINAETTEINIDKTRAESVEPPRNTPAAAVITPEEVHINIPRSKTSSPEPLPTLKIDSKGPKSLRTVDLHDNANGRSALASGQTTTQVGNAIIRQGFANGEIIVTLLPVNTKWPWITPAQFRPELVPEELMAQGLTLTVEDYVHVMELLTNDVRFNLYNVCYKRILVVWIFTAFFVLLGLLFSGITGLTLFGLGVMWLIMNGGAVVLCLWLKIKLNHNLEKCMGQVNKHLIKHKIIMGLDDRGKISCHKVNLCFIYFDSTDCIKKLQEVIEREEREGRPVNREESADERRQRSQFQQRMDIDDTDIVIQGSTTSRVSRKQVRGERVLLRYLQRWGKDFLRRRLDWTVDETGGNPVDPRHLTSALCPCQYIEEYLRNKPRSNRALCCPSWHAMMKDLDLD